MGVRYDDWDKQRYKTTRSMPWWHKHIRTAQCIGWATIFIWGFGSLYKMLLFPPKEIRSRSLDPRYVGLNDDAKNFRENILKREEALHEERIKSEKKKNANV